MRERKRSRNFKFLLLLVLLALVYAILLVSLPTLTGIHRLDGSIGVLLGLYICSHPAAHIVDIMFFDRFFFSPGITRRKNIFWLLTNVLVMAIGWGVIVIGSTRFMMGEF
jgi:hypothetical protein